MLALVPHDLTNLPSVLAVGGGLGLVLGGIVGLCWRSPTDADLVSNITAGCALGTFLGTLLSFVVALAALAAGA